MQSSATTSSSLSLVLIYSFVPIVHSRCTESLSIRNDMTTSPPDPQPTWLKNYLHPPCPQSVHSNSKLQSTTQGRDNSSSLAGQHVAREFRSYFVLHITLSSSLLVFGLCTCPVVSLLPYVDMQINMKSHFHSKVLSICCRHPILRLMCINFL